MSIFYRHLSDYIIQVLENVARNMQTKAEITDLLIKLLGLFSQLGIKVKEMNEKQNNIDKGIVKVKTTK